MKKIFVTLMLAGLCASPVISANDEMTAARVFRMVSCGVVQGAAIAGGALLAKAVVDGGLDLIHRGVTAATRKMSKSYQDSRIQKAFATIPNSLKVGARVALVGGTMSALKYRDSYGHWQDKVYALEDGLYVGSLWASIWACYEGYNYYHVQKAKAAAEKAKQNVPSIRIESPHVYAPRPILEESAVTDCYNGGTV